MSKLTGGQIAGGNTVSTRAEHDYYATDPKAVNMLLEKYNFCKANILEPCVGAGHIAETLTDYYNNYPNITAIDIVDRGYPNTIVQDFLTWETNEKFEGIITIIWIESQYVFYVLIDYLASDRLIVKNHEYI